MKNKKIKCDIYQSIYKHAVMDWSMSNRIL